MVSPYLICPKFEVFDRTWYGSVANQLVSSGTRGAIVGGAQAKYEGRDVVDGMQEGAKNYMLANSINMGLGHGIGLATSGFDAPVYYADRDIFVYYTDNHPLWQKGITLGNVVTINNDPLTGIHPRKYAEVHREEYVHTQQEGEWGPSFIPVYFIQSGSAILQGENYYGGNQTEVDAKHCAQNWSTCRYNQ